MTKSIILDSLSDDHQQLIHKLVNSCFKVSYNELLIASLDKANRTGIKQQILILTPCTEEYEEAAKVLIEAGLLVTTSLSQAK